MTNQYPKIRSVQVHSLVSDGQPVLLLQDPLQLSEQSICIHRVLAPILFFLDGTRDLDELGAMLLIQAGIRLSKNELVHLVGQLDDALLLDNERSASAMQVARETFRTASYRPPAIAGNSYPADPAELGTLLDGYLAAAGSAETVPFHRSLRGLISPHIDFERGGPVYAGVWSSAAEAVRAAELVIVLGTDHNGTPGSISLTRQNYATPYGVLPTEVTIVDALARTIGEENAFAEELNHRYEHSIELAAIWLHHLRGGVGSHPCSVVPILTGSFYSFVCGEADIYRDRSLVAMAEVLGGIIRDRKTLIVAAGDLAHVGPAFDDPFPIDEPRKRDLKSHDERLIDIICAGNSEAFFQFLEREDDRYNVCGLPPIYLLLRALGTTRGTLTGYDQCPADLQDTSFVSICGIILE